MSDYQCPVEGCDFGEEEPRSYRSVLSHINAMSDSDHDKSAREAVEAGAPEALVEASDEDEANQGEEGAESDTEGASEQAESDPEEGGMATPEEYEQQQTDVETEASSETTDEEAPSSGESESDESSTESGFGVPMTRQTLLVAGVGLALVGGYYWFVVRESDQTGPASAAEAPASDTTDEEESAQEGAEGNEAGALWE